MSAALLSASSSEIDSGRDQIALARFLLALHPFTVACFVAQWLDDPIETILHNDAPALVLEASPQLRRILTVEAFDNDQQPFWIYREAATQHENQTEAFWRDRSGKTLTAPCWHGDERPKGYRKVKLKTQFPSLQQLLHLAALGYPWNSVEAALPRRAHEPWLHPVADRRAHGVIIKSDDDEKDDEKKRDSHGIVDPAHPYVPMAPGRRTLVGGGIPMIQVTRAIAKHHWDDVTSFCVLEIVYRRESPLQLSKTHGVPLRRLHEYARQIRKAIKSDPRNDFAQ